MTPRRERAARVAGRDETGEAHQEQELPQQLPEMISAAQVTELVAQAVEATMVAMARYFPRDQPQALVVPDVQAHPGLSGW